MNSRFKRWGYEFIQSAVLAIPFAFQIHTAAHKARSFLKVWHYLSTNKIYGDYLEFGVFEGRGFKLALKSARKMFKSKTFYPRFFAFDSFQGLPSIDKTKDAPNVFYEKTLVCSEETFLKRVHKSSRNEKMYTVPGYFSESLTASVRDKFDIRFAAFVNIDCDLYDSALTALRFVGPSLKTGSVIYFDDWFLSGGDMRRGEAGACARHRGPCPPP